MNGFACILSNEAMIHLRGTNIAEFLQGQLSCDTRKLTLTSPVTGALCNVKGRVLSDLTVIAVSDSHVLLRLRRSLGQNIADTLQRYAQFSRISVELDLREDAIAGQRTGEAVAVVNASANGSLDSSIGNGVLRYQRSATHSELISVDSPNPVELLDIIGDHVPDTETRWAAETLRVGHYSLELEDLALFTPQALNYDLSGLVAFDKGCYTGQEIVARLHYKGQSKRRLQVFEVSGLDFLARDTALQDSEGANIGRCLRAEAIDDSRLLVAAEVQSDHLGNTAFLSGQERLNPLRAPYLQAG